MKKQQINIHASKTTFIRLLQRFNAFIDDIWTQWTYVYIILSSLNIFQYHVPSLLLLPKMSEPEKGKMLKVKKTENV
jgi:hypothetical protein